MGARSDALAASEKGGSWILIGRIEATLAPSARRTELANGLRQDVALLREVERALAPPSAEPMTDNPPPAMDENPVDPRCAAEVRRELRDTLEAALAAAPKVGTGARRARFIRHVQAVARRYDCGLFACYDEALLPRTTNAVERIHGEVKRHLRKCSGRCSTAGGVAQTIGEWLPGAVMLVLVIGFAALASLLATVPAAAYRAARREQCTLTEPARRYRSMQRRPQRFFTRSLARWQAKVS